MRPFARFASIMLRNELENLIALTSFKQTNIEIYNPI